MLEKNADGKLWLLFILVVFFLILLLLLSLLCSAKAALCSIRAVCG